MTGMSRFDIDKLSEPYYLSGGFNSNYFETHNNIEILKISKLDIESDSAPYASTG